MVLEIGDDIVISGIGGWFPKVDNVEDLSYYLLNGCELIDSKWDEFQITNKIGSINEIDRFDASFFAINPKQCEEMDVLSRKALEASFSAILDAGVNVNELRGTNTCVSIGSSVSESDRNVAKLSETGFGVTGHARSMLSNRVSYYLDLKGPSTSFMNSWISGLQSIRFACDFIRNGTCSNAIVGDCNVLVHPEIFQIYNKLGVLSGDGVTRSFDEKANGYGRSDCVVVFFLQRAKDAKRSYAYVEKIETIFIGNRFTDLFSVSKNDLITFLRKFYEDRDCCEQLEYLEAYGAGIKEIDSLELEAIEQSICKKFKYTEENPLLIGSVKSSMGHAEGAASLIAIVKIIIAMENRILPANRNFEKMSRNSSTIKVVDKNTKWNGKLAAMNCFGFAGDFGHILLRSDQKHRDYKFENLPILTTVSSINENSILKVLNKIDETREITLEYMNLVNESFAKTISGHFNRGFYLRNLENGHICKHYENFTNIKRPLWFVFSGMGSQWPGMGKELMKLPLFRKAIEKCDRVLKPYKVDVFEILGSSNTKIFDNILNCFIGITAVQIGLTDILRSLGLEPDGIIGHSAGEIGCSYCDGCLSAEEAILASYLRGKVSLETKVVHGTMAAVGLGYRDIKDMLPETIEVACRNGPDSCTISGPTKDVEKFAIQLKSNGVFVKLVNVSNIAYHSRYVQKMVPKLNDTLNELIKNPKKRSKKWICTSQPEHSWKTKDVEYLTGSYLTNNLKNYVYFEEGLKFIPANAVLIEIAPYGILQAILKRSLNSSCTNISLTKKFCENPIETLFQSLGYIYAAGYDLCINNLYPKLDYPVSNGTKSLAPLVEWNHDVSYVETFYNPKQELVDYKVPISRSDIKYKNLLNYRLFYDRKLFMPIGLFLRILLEKFFDLTKQFIFRFRDLHFSDLMELSFEELKIIEIMVQLRAGYFEITLKDKILVCGFVDSLDRFEKFECNRSETPSKESMVRWSGDLIYNEFERKRMYFEENLRQIDRIEYDGESAWIRASINARITTYSNVAFDLIEAALQVILFYEGEKLRRTNAVKHIQLLAVDLQSIRTTHANDFVLNYNTKTQSLHSNGLLIKRVKLNMFDEESMTGNTMSEQLNRRVFIEFNCTVSGNDRIQLSQWLHAILQIAFTNFPESAKKNVLILDDYCDRALIDEIAKISTDSFQVRRFAPASDADAKNTILLTNSNTFINFRGSNSFIISEYYAENLNESYEILSKFENGSRKIYFLKEKYDEHKSCLIAKLDRSEIVHFKSQEWFLQIDSRKLCQSIFLVASQQFDTELLSVLTEIISIAKNAVKFVFIDAFDLEKNYYENLARISLEIFCVENCKIGFFCFVPFFDGQAGRKFEKLPLAIEYLRSGDFLSNKFTKCLGIVLCEKTDSDFAEKWDVVDYVSENTNEEAGFGLCKTLDGFEKVADPIYFWKMPSSWSFEDAVSVPYAYTMAYYSLTEVVNVQKGDIVLIHDGHKLVNQALLNIAMQFNCRVFTTVETNEQIVYMTHKYYFLNENNCFLSKDFYSGFNLRTCGTGANLIFNTCNDTSVIEDSFRSLAKFGRLLHFFENRIDFKKSIGMLPFLNSTTIIPIVYEQIFELDDRTKIRLKNAVEDGIDRLFVRPLERQSISSFERDSILKFSKLSTLETKLYFNFCDMKRNEINYNQYQCFSYHCYVIFGMNRNQVIDLLEWLVYRGARKLFVFTLEREPKSIEIEQRRLHLLDKYYRATIEYRFVSDFDRFDNDLMPYLLNIKQLHVINAVFMLPLFDENKRNFATRNFLELSLRKVSPQTLLVCCLFDCRSWPKTNKTELTYLIDMEENSFETVLDRFDCIFAEQLTECSIRNGYRNRSLARTESRNNIDYLLPVKLDDLGWKQKNHLKLIPSQCPNNFREIPPVFLFPGFQTNESIRKFAMSLYYPVYVLDENPADFLPFEDRVKQIVQQMTEIYEKGPFNLIAVSIDGLVGLEVMKLLEKRQLKTKIFLIDSAPEIIKGILGQLVTSGSSHGDGNNRLHEIELELIRKYMNIADDHKAMDSFVKKYNWPDKIEALKNNNFDQLSSLTLIRSKIEESQIYLHNKHTNSNELIEGYVHLLKPLHTGEDDDCFLAKISKQSIKINLVQGNHRSIFVDEQLAQIINNEILVSKSFDLN